LGAFDGVTMGCCFGSVVSLTVSTFWICAISTVVETGANDASDTSSDTTNTKAFGFIEWSLRTLLSLQLYRLGV
jgi:hypothetical protein